ncbi:hypothetical protein FKP32DRAFT_1608570 [Trametes sanguinea]|nr:hypothetical protein FKP32DRAFT_1608570 [Trametes sanguinea]
MQFALTIEHLENAFYSDGLSKYSAQAFEQAGFSSWVYGRFQQIADNEAAHVAYLNNTLGSDAPAPCTYNFPHTDVKSFINMAQKIESISAGAYLGAARHINDTSILNAGVAIAGTESRQAGWITSSVLKQQPWDGAFETDIPPSPAFSLIQDFIVECPDSNPALPLATLPTLKISNPTPKAGDSITLTFEPGSSASPLYALWADGLNYTFTDVNNNQTTVPDGLSGTVYVGVVTAKGAPNRTTFASGWAPVDFPFDSSARPEAQ